MTAAANSAQPVGANPKVRSLSGPRHWDRTIALSEEEAAALLALGRQRLRSNKAVGIPRRPAQHWRVLVWFPRFSADSRARFDLKYVSLID
jgi:hypothetical protein